MRGRATLFMAQVNNQIWSRNFYHDDYNTIVNYTMTDVDQQHFGTEIGLEAMQNALADATQARLDSTGARMNHRESGAIGVVSFSAVMRRKSIGCSDPAWIR